ncbi:DUF454 domain-containing protein [Streptococcus chenjunshii]|uniref:DUF454 domain-containing protein n=1 Tax=Streptococcus chenjunshii TaxID=2173853 RepID=A0A372KN89_9STRE|nr:YbaN family protein [Streptococcus chenjunshii]AXQ77854.1 DUF454 domain-containing protein [Streptococcus chenjunshii]RFU50027.1 DUF454 domain-containing protein [Streptococcus chenjunshii]RFU53761.1 DUF454 domain-containing protein [Streptococcus chenjunshii]
MKKMLLIAAGCLSLLLGVLGVILPVLPTTPFLLLSGYCFARSSKKFERWLKQTKLYQFYVADYAETKSIAKERKKKIIIQIYLLMGLSVWLAPLVWVKLALLALTVFITYYLFRVIPDK